jgi:hypothetical protein
MSDRQQITIQVDGRAGRVEPESVGDVLRAVFHLLDVIGEKSWNVQTSRVQWRISGANYSNPLTLTVTGDEKHGDNAPDLPGRLIECFEQIEHGERPLEFGAREMKLTRLLGNQARRARSIKIINTSRNKVRTFDIERSFWAKVDDLIRRPKLIRREYGSIDGTLFQLINDPKREDGSAKIRDRVYGHEVVCSANPGTTTEMARYVNRESRIVVYGFIRYEDEVPVKIDVESFVWIPPDDELPTLDDVHALHLRPPEGRTVEDYLEDLRGDG